MDKKKIQELMKKRNPMREVVKPVDFFEEGKKQASKTVSQQNSKPVTKKSLTKEKKVIKYTTYLPEELVTKIKMQAVLQKKKGYQIIVEALEEYFSK